MSLEVNIGKRGNILDVGPENASQVEPSFFIHSGFILYGYQRVLSQLNFSSVF